MKIGKLLVYDEIFGNESPRDPTEYLKGISKIALIRISAWFLSGFYDDTEFLCRSGKFFPSDCDDFTCGLYQHIQLNGGGIIINTHSSLEFLTIVLQLPDCDGNDNNNNNPSDFDFALNIFQAYLVINQRIVEKEKLLITKMSNHELDLPSALFCQSLAYSDFTNYDYKSVLAAQLTKAFYFFEFCETQLPTHLALFCKKYTHCNWKDYLKADLGRVLSLDDKKELQFMVVAQDEDKLFLDKYSINGQSNPANDYTLIRQFPLYKETDSSYIVLFKLFAAERIYRSLYFEFNGINKGLDDLDVTKIKDFRTKIADEFSEGYILYKVLDQIFKDNKFINFKGSDYKAANKSIEGEPDYYVRESNHIFLFESKDILLNADIKSSYNSEAILSDFKKKLGEKKGVKQLHNNIKKILERKMPLDADYNESSIIIYPIMILHERIYSCMGLNAIVNSWLQEFIKRDQVTKSTNQIQPLIIIDLDTLLEFLNLENEDDYCFKDILDQYIQSITKAEAGSDPWAIVGKMYNSFKNFAEPILEKTRSKHLKERPLFIKMKSLLE